MTILHKVFNLGIATWKYVYEMHSIQGSQMLVQGKRIQVLGCFFF